MNILVNPEEKVWKKAVERPVLKTKQINKIVKPILRKVKRNGDKALIKYAYEFDHVELESLLVPQSEIKAAADELSPELKEAIQKAKANIEKGTPLLLVTRVTESIDGKLIEYRESKCRTDHYHYQVELD